MGRGGGESRGCVGDELGGVLRGPVWLQQRLRFRKERAQEWRGLEFKAGNVDPLWGYRDWLLPYMALARG